MSGFGPHLTLDIWGCKHETLSDLNLVFSYLNETPKKIGMTKITQPYVFPYSGLVPEDEGISGNVVIAESHLSVHTFALKGWAFFDAFSCRNFDVDAMVLEVVTLFKPTDYRKEVLYRGKGFPR